MKLRSRFFTAFGPKSPFFPVTPRYNTNPAAAFLLSLEPIKPFCWAGRSLSSCLPARAASGVRAVFEYVGRLAFQRLAQSVEGADAYGLRLAGLEDGQIGCRDAYPLCQLAASHLAAGEHHVYVHDDSHGVFLFGAAGLCLLGLSCWLAALEV